MQWDFDRFLRYDELSQWLAELAAEHPDLVTVESYGRSHEGRDLQLVTVTDASTGAHDRKPAHWIDASIHAVELTATVGACYLLHHLVGGYRSGDERVRQALRTRTFYVVPRVNPDGAEWALADRPRFRRSSTRRWPDADGALWPGAYCEDIDGDGRILDMRIPDPNGAWMPHPDEPRLLVPIPFDGPPPGTPRYRTLLEGYVEQYDGFTVPTPRPAEGLDLNRNFPAGWGTSVGGSGDHPMSEPEIDALVRAIVARPNICGYNAFHTSGGVLLRPSSTQPDSALPPEDLWVWNEFGRRGTELTGYPVHSVYEDFTWDRHDTMSGAADDWAYEHLGVFAWTTEFWDIVYAATGTRQPTTMWVIGPTADEALGVLRWLDQQPGDARHAGFVDWYEFDHPQLGPVELGGWNSLYSWTNPPLHLLRTEVAPHAEFAVAQALAAPDVRLADVRVEDLGPVASSGADAVGADAVEANADEADADEANEEIGVRTRWRVGAEVHNVGWLPTHVSKRGAAAGRGRGALTGDVSIELVGGGGVVWETPQRVRVGPLAGASAARFEHGMDGTPDRARVEWYLVASREEQLTISVKSGNALSESRILEFR